MLVQRQWQRPVSPFDARRDALPTHVRRAKTPGNANEATRPPRCPALTRPRAPVFAYSSPCLFRLLQSVRAAQLDGRTSIQSVDPSMISRINNNNPQVEPVIMFHNIVNYASTAMKLDRDRTGGPPAALCAARRPHLMSHERQRKGSLMRSQIRLRCLLSVLGADLWVSSFQTSADGTAPLQRHRAAVRRAVLSVVTSMPSSCASTM